MTSIEIAEEYTETKGGVLTPEELVDFLKHWAAHRRVVVNTVMHPDQMDLLRDEPDIDKKLMALIVRDVGEHFFDLQVSTVHGPGDEYKVDLIITITPKI